MDHEIYTVEDLLESIAGLTTSYNMTLERNDMTIMYSIARQVHKGVALTDKQLELVQEKLKTKTISNDGSDKFKKLILQHD